MTIYLCADFQLGTNCPIDRRTHRIVAHCAADRDGLHGFAGVDLVILRHIVPCEDRRGGVDNHFVAASVIDRQGITHSTDLHADVDHAIIEKKQGIAIAVLICTQVQKPLMRDAVVKQGSVAILIGL